MQCGPIKKEPRVTRGNRESRPGWEATTMDMIII